jgi:hypothetical protein
MCVSTGKYSRVKTSITLNVRMMEASHLQTDVSASEPREAPVDVRQRVS